MSTAIGSREKVRALVAGVGLAKAAIKLGVCREAVSKYLAGLPVRAGTAALIERNIETA